MTSVPSVLSSVARKALVLLVAPLLVNILLFVAYVLAGPLFIDPATLATMRQTRPGNLLVIRLLAFAKPVAYVLIRSRGFKGTLSGYEVALRVHQLLGV